MATFDSTATLPVSAPRPDGKNLLIKIDVATGRFHCDPVEHVGTHKNRYVTFQPDAACKLYFSNSAVFKMNDKQLVKGKNDLQVLDETDGVETSCSLDGATTEKVARTVFGPPVIVVP